MTAPDVPALSADLEAGLRRLKLRTMRALAPEVLQTAKVQRWAPDELLRTLVDAEIGARDQAGEAGRRRQARSRRGSPRSSRAGVTAPPEPTRCPCSPTWNTSAARWMTCAG